MLWDRRLLLKPVSCASGLEDTVVLQLQTHDQGHGICRHSSSLHHHRGGETEEKIFDEDGNQRVSFGGRRLADIYFKK